MASPEGKRKMTTLPTIYSTAKSALAQCAKIDECREWADKAAALAVYAKQIEDSELERNCRRIKARAADRCGELLKQADARGDHMKKGGAPLSQKKMAAEAGMSSDQVKQAVRVNNVPRDKFERLVESSEPPTVTALAKLGTKKRGEAECYEVATDHPNASTPLKAKFKRQKSRAAQLSRMAPSTLKGWRDGYLAACANPILNVDLDEEMRIIVDGLQEIAGRRMRRSA
jgi:hypothetical protein